MTPSPRQVHDAFTDLAQTARQLLEIDPNMPEEHARLWQDMLEAQAEGDPFKTLDRLVHAAVLAEHHAEGVRIYRTALAERLDRQLRSAGKIREIVKRFLEQLQLTTLVRPTYSASITAGRAHVVPTQDAKDMPPRFQRVTVEVDKSALTEALRAKEPDVPAHWSNPEPILTIRTR